MDQIAVAVDICDRIPEEGQVIDREDTCLKRAQVFDVPGRLIESGQFPAVFGKPLFCCFKGTFAYHVQMRAHDFEGDYINICFLIEGRGHQVYCKPEVSIRIKQDQLAIARRTQVIERAARTKQFFALTLPFTEREGAVKEFIGCFHDRKGGTH